jgi:UDP-glucose 4-epimerase
MRVIVTGGAGFIGTNLIKRLLKEDHEVISIDNYSTGKVENHIEGVKYYIKENICNILIDPPWQLISFKPDVVFHLAAIARIQPSFKNPSLYLETNYKGTYEVVKYCTELNIPLIYAGSSSHHSGRFKNPYTFSKDMGEDIIKLYQKHFNLKASIARFYNVYGPHQLTEGGYTTLIGRWLNNIEKGLPCEIYGDGSKRRDFTHVDDIVEALIRIVDREKYGYVFELGRGKNYTVNSVAKMLGIKPIYKEDKPGEALTTLANRTEAELYLEWDAKINLEDYILKLKKEWTSTFTEQNSTE